MGPNVTFMKQTTQTLAACVLALCATSADARCFADYKAKQDEPLRLHYGVIELMIDPCEVSPAVEKDVSSRIGADGWALLQIVSTFDESEVEGKRDDAGDYFLRY